MCPETALLMLFAILSESILDTVLPQDSISSCIKQHGARHGELQSHGCCLGIGAHGHLLSHVLDTLLNRQVAQVVRVQASMITE